MKRHIVSISSANYREYTAGLVSSVRAAGWNEDVIIFTPDDIAFDNCTVKNVRQTITSKVFNDVRWIKSDLLNYFDDGDIVLYLDSDIVVNPGFDRVFEYEFATAWTDRDNVGDIEKAEKYLQRKLPAGRYFDAVIVAKINKETRRFWNVWKLATFPSIKMGRGTVCAFNIAIDIMQPDIKKLPRCYHFFTLDGLNNIPKDVCIIHYAGHDGKRVYKEKRIAG